MRSEVKFEGRDSRIDLFKYGIISPLLNQEEQKVRKLCQELSKKEYFYKGKNGKYSEETIRKWYYKYKKEGFDKLNRKIRNDIEKTRKLSEEAIAYVVVLREKYPKMTIKKIYDKLIEERFITLDTKVDVLYRYCKTNDMQRQKVLKEERRRYEKRYPNETWQGDTSYGPYIIIDGKKYRTYLIHFIDDNSRLVVGHGFYLSDSAINVQKVLKEAIATYGVPKQIYLDNGKSYSNIQLELICARLGIKLTHTHAFDPESKGKCERCFKTIKEGWMYGKDWNLFKSLEDLNKDYDKYLYESYNNHYHSEIKDTPNNVWHKGITETIHKTIDEEKIEEAFMHEIVRKVNKDRTVNINNKLYEAPSLYKLQKVHLRYYLKNIDEIWIYENGERKEKLNILNKKDNSEIKRVILDYTKIVNDERDVLEYEEKEESREYEE